MGLFLGSMFYSIDLYIYALLIPHSLQNYIEIISLYWCFSLNFFQNCSILFPLLVHIKFLITCSISSLKKLAGILIRCILNLHTNLERIEILQTLSLTVQNTDTAFHLLRSSLISLKSFFCFVLFCFFSAMFYIGFRSLAFLSLHWLSTILL